MSPAIVGVLGILVLFALLLLRLPVWAALSLVGLVGNAALSGWAAPSRRWARRRSTPRRSTRCPSSLCSS